MNLLHKVLAKDLRTEPFGKWLYEKTKLEKTENNYLRFFLEHFKRSEDIFQVITDIMNPEIELIRIEHAFYLGLQGNTTTEIQKKLKGFYQQSIDHYTEVIDFIENQFGLSRHTSSPLKGILRELIKNAFEGSIHDLNANFKIDRGNINKAEREQLLAQHAIKIEQENPNIMKFYIHLSNKLDDQGHKKRDQVRFIIISPQIKEKDYEKLQEKIKIYNRLKAEGKGFHDYLSDEYDAEKYQGHELGTIMSLCLVQAYWNDDAKIDYDFSKNQTKVTLSIKI